jgi:transcriptional antiterminator
MNNREHEYSTKTRILRVLRAVTENKFRYTKKQLADTYGVSENSIKDDFRQIRNAGFNLKIDNKYRYGIERFE